MIKVDPTIMLQEIIGFIERHINQGYPEPSDYTIRYCEAIVAGFAGYSNRVDWTLALHENSEDTLYLDILRDIEAYRKEHEYKDIPFVCAVRECLCQIHKHFTKEIAMKPVENILERYPKEKPVCFNYATAVEDFIALSEENTYLRKRLAAYEEGLNPDAAAVFSEEADAILMRLDKLIASSQNINVSK